MVITMRLLGLAAILSAAVGVEFIHAAAPAAPTTRPATTGPAARGGRGAGAARGGNSSSPLSPDFVEPTGTGGTIDGVAWARGYDQEFAGIKPLAMNLWPLGKDPNPSANARPEDNRDGERVGNVSVPGMLVYLPSKEKLAASGGASIIICCGGAYSHLTRFDGGDGTVKEFAPKGIAIVSLKYKLTPATRDPEHEGVAAAQRAIRTMRLHAKEWGIDPNKIGLMGWSAGGNLILSLNTHMKNNGDGDPNSSDPIERENCKPNFSVLWSPWPNPGTKIEDYIPAAGVTLPPAMIGGAQDDTTAPFPYVTSVKDLWLKAGGDAEFIVQPTGKHQSFELKIGEAKNWPEKFLPWMEKHGFWKPGA